MARSLYLKPRTYSVALFIALNLLPKDEVSIVVCFLLVQYIEDELRKTKNPVRLCLVLLSPAWSESSYTMILNSLPNGFGKPFGISSFSLSRPCREHRLCCSNLASGNHSYQYQARLDQKLARCCALIQDIGTYGIVALDDLL